MKKFDVVSVIVAVYNIEEYINKCIESIICQQYEYLDIILVDDGSEDQCPQICDEWSQKDSRIQVIHQNNQGLSAARNAGIDVAKGEYIVFVDGDDYLEADYVLTLHELIVANDADMSVCNFYFVNEIEKQASKDKANVFDWKGSGRELLLLEAREHIFLGMACCKMYSKEQFAKLRFPKGKMHEDVFVFHEIMWDVDNVVCTGKPLYNYVQRANSITHEKMSERKLLDSIEARKNKVHFYHKKNADELWEIAIWDYIGAMKNALNVYKTVISKNNKKILFSDLREAVLSVWKKRKCAVTKVVKEGACVGLLWMKNILEFRKEN